MTNAALACRRQDVQTEYIMMSKWIVALLSLSSAVQAQSVDEILTRYSQAVGGVERIRAIQTVRIVQRVEDGNPPQPSFVIVRKRGNRFRYENKIPTAKGEIEDVGVCDGRSSWTQFGNSPPQSATGNPYCTGTADIDDLLLGFWRKPKNAQMVGKERLLDKDVYHLKFGSPGTQQTMDCFLDAESFLPLRVVYNAGPARHEDTFRDYRDIDGIKFPFVTEQRWWPIGREPAQRSEELKSTPEEGHQKQIVTKLEFNLPIDDSIFSMPRTK